MQELFRALPALLKEFDDNEDVREAVVFAAWRKIAGDALRERAVPYRLFKKHLIIAVMSDTWKKHLEHLSGQMIFKINSALSAAVVTFIEFRVDEEAVYADRAKQGGAGYSQSKKEPDDPLANITPKMRHSADAIKDENLRYQFLLAAGSCLERKKRIKNSDK